MNVGPEPRELRERELVARGARADHRLPADRGRVAQGRRRQDHDDAEARPHVRLSTAATASSRSTATPTPGSLAYRVRRETTNDDHRPAARPRRDRPLRRHPRVHLPGRRRGWRSWRPTTTRSITDALREQDFNSVVDLLEPTTTSSAWTPAPACWSPPSKGILQLADQLVRRDGAEPRQRRAPRCARWTGWSKNGHADLVAGRGRGHQRGAAARASSTSTASSDTSQARCRAVVRIPWDPALDAGAEASLEDLRPATREAYLALRREGRPRLRGAGPPLSNAQVSSRARISCSPPTTTTGSPGRPARPSGASGSVVSNSAATTLSPGSRAAISRTARPEHLQAAEDPGDDAGLRVDLKRRQLAHERQRRQRGVRGRVVGEGLGLGGLLVHDDRAEPGALDHRRRRRVERDAHAQRAAAVQQLARERDGEVPRIGPPGRSEAARVRHDAATRLRGSPSRSASRGRRPMPRRRTSRAARPARGRGRSRRGAARSCRLRA